MNLNEFETKFSSNLNILNNLVQEIANRLFNTADHESEKPSTVCTHSAYLADKKMVLTSISENVFDIYHFAVSKDTLAVSTGDLLDNVSELEKMYHEIELTIDTIRMNLKAIVNKFGSNCNDAVSNEELNGEAPDTYENLLFSLNFSISNCIECAKAIFEFVRIEPNPNERN